MVPSFSCLAFVSHTHFFFVPDTSRDIFAWHFQHMFQPFHVSMFPFGRVVPPSVVGFRILFPGVSRWSSHLPWKWVRNRHVCLIPLGRRVSEVDARGLVRPSNTQHNTTRQILARRCRTHDKKKQEKTDGKDIGPPFLE